MVAKNVFLIFLTKSTLTLHNISITRLQILIMLCFIVMEYKIQEATF